MGRRQIYIIHILNMHRYVERQTRWSKLVRWIYERGETQNAHGPGTDGGEGRDEGRRLVRGRGLGS